MSTKNMLALFGFIVATTVSKPPPYAGSLVLQGWAGLHIWQGGKIGPAIKCRDQVYEWSPKLHKLLCASLPHQVSKWMPGDAAPSVIVDYGKLIPTTADLIWDQDIVFSLSPDLSTLALYAGGVAKKHLWFIDLATKKVRGVLTDDDIRRAGAPDPQSAQVLLGLAWTPDSNAVAVGVAGKDEGKEDGEGRTECVLVTRNGKATYLGRGMPIAWMNANRLLCLREVGKSFRPIPEILSRLRSKPILGKGSGFSLTFDGKNIVFVQNHLVQILDANLKLRRQFKITTPEEDPFPTGPLLIALPPDTLRLAGK